MAHTCCTISFLSQMNLDSRWFDAIWILNWNTLFSIIALDYGCSIARLSGVNWTELTYMHGEIYTRQVVVLVGVDPHRSFFWGIERNKILRTDGKKTKTEQFFQLFPICLYEMECKFYFHTCSTYVQADLWHCNKLGSWWYWAIIIEA